MFIVQSGSCLDLPDVLGEQLGDPPRVWMAMRRPFAWLIVLAALGLAGCGSTPSPHPHFKVGSPSKINGRWYQPQRVSAYEATGIASWYGSSYHGRLTANGELYDMYALSAAHPTLQLPSLVQVTNLANGRSLVLRVNDRGPFVKGRLIDLSWAAAHELGFERQGLARVHVVFLGNARLDDQPPHPGERRAYAALR
jgi:rare lipoprotein A